MRGRGSKETDMFHNNNYLATPRRQGGIFTIE
jgi:hypothetical protein